jgi:hypothetical protein
MVYGLSLPAVAPLLWPHRKASREAILAGISTLLPSHVPFGLAPEDSPPPAQLLHTFVDNQIAKFSARVTKRAAEHRAETRWFWQRSWEAFAANFRWAWVCTSSPTPCLVAASQPVASRICSAFCFTSVCLGKQMQPHQLW